MPTTARSLSTALSSDHNCSCLLLQYLLLLNIVMHAPTDYEMFTCTVGVTETFGSDEKESVGAILEPIVSLSLSCVQNILSGRQSAIWFMNKDAQRKLSEVNR